MVLIKSLSGMLRLTHCATVVMLATLWFLTACTPRGLIGGPSVKLDPPSNSSQLGKLAYSATGNLIVQDADERIWYQPEGQSIWREISIPADSACLRTRYYLNSALPDGRIGLVKICTGAWRDSLGRMFHTKAYIVGYDVTSSSLDLLTEDYLPATGQFTWNSGISKGILSTNGSYSTLYWLTPQGTEPISITLTDGTYSWHLPDSISAIEEYKQSTRRTGRELHSVGNVGMVDWSPTGEYIAFWATLDPIGQPYDLLRVMAWDLYLLSPDTLHLERVLENVYDAGGVHWSPNGNWLAYTTGKKDRQPAGLWLFSLQNRTSVLLKKGQYRSIAWSTDGRSIVTLSCTDSQCRSTEILKFDVGQVIDSQK